MKTGNVLGNSLSAWLALTDSDPYHGREAFALSSMHCPYPVCFRPTFPAPPPRPFDRFRRRRARGSGAKTRCSLRIQPSGQYASVCDLQLAWPTAALWRALQSTLSTRGEWFLVPGVATILSPSLAMNQQYPLTTQRVWVTQGVLLVPATGRRWRLRAVIRCFGLLLSSLLLTRGSRPTQQICF